MTTAWFTSKANYQKIHSKGSGTLSLSSTFGSTASATVTHNLGYKPNVRVFFEPDNDGDIWVPHQNSIYSDATLTYRITNTTVTITATQNGFTGRTVPYYYRIYLDGETETNLEYSSESNIEKIVFSREGEFSIGSGSGLSPTFKQEVIAHGQGRAEFVKMVFSRDDSSWYEESTVQRGSPPFGASAQFTVAIAHMDATNIYIEAQNAYPSTQTIYYKVAAFRRD